MNEYGFIITRHVNSELTNKYWNNCVKCIRHFYPYRKIIIIDDNSKKDYLKSFYNYENIDISSLSSGYYIIQLQSGNGKINRQKLLVE